MFESGSICQGQDSHSNAESAGQSTMFPFEIEGRDVPDVAEEIFSHLDDKTLFKFRVVSKRWKEAIVATEEACRNKSIYQRLGLSKFYEKLWFILKDC